MDDMNKAESNLTAETALMHVECSILENELAEAITKRDNERKILAFYEDVLSQAAYLLRDGIVWFTSHYDLEQTVSSLAGSVQHATAKDEHLFEGLLEVLKRATTVDEKVLEEYNNSCATPKADDALINTRQSPLTDEPATVSHYSIGDAGMVPSPSRKILSKYEEYQKNRAAVKSAQGRLNRLQALNCKSIAVQTDDTKKFFADQLLNYVTPVNSETVVRKFAAEKYAPMAAIRRTLDK